MAQTETLRLLLNMRSVLPEFRARSDPRTRQRRHDGIPARLPGRCDWQGAAQPIREESASRPATADLPTRQKRRCCALAA
jgi:hypothetical protein